MDQFLAASALRGAAYEGFFRSTRPYVLAPGRFVHDHGMIRRDPNGLLRLRMGTGGTVVDGWVLPMGAQLFIIAIDVISGAVLFGLFNGVGTARADVVDGLVLAPALDAGRTPTAHAMTFERIGDLTGDPEADDRRFQELAALDPVAPKARSPTTCANTWPATSAQRRRPAAATGCCRCRSPAPGPAARPTAKAPQAALRLEPAGGARRPPRRSAAGSPPSSAPARRASSAGTLPGTSQASSSCARWWVSRAIGAAQRPASRRRRNSAVSARRNRRSPPEPRAAAPAQQVQVRVDAWQGLAPLASAPLTDQPA